MTNYKAVPIQLLSAPNDYVPLPNNQWVIDAGAPATLALQLFKSDTLGTRPFIVPVGGTLQVVFPRSDDISQPKTGSIVVTQRTITKSTTLDANNRSLATFAISSDDSNGIVSGTVQFNLTISGNTYSWLQNWAIKKVSQQAAL